MKKVLLVFCLVSLFSFQEMAHAEVPVKRIKSEGKQELVLKRPPFDKEKFKEAKRVREVKIATRLVEKTNIKPEVVLELKKNKTWGRVRYLLGLPLYDNSFRKGENQRYGAGFAGLHVRNMTAERAAKIWHEDYLFSEAELVALYNELGYVQAENILLHAYMGKTTIEKVKKLRIKNDWDKIKLKLGLTPSVYYERCVEFQARRMEERLDIPAEITKKYMHMGYPMHHIALGYLLSIKTGKELVTIMDSKIPAEKWESVGERLGVSLDEVKVEQKKISKAFGRHE